MLPASYISLQSALAYYGMIPEHVPVTTSVTTSRPAHWETPLGIFDFRHIQVDFFDGYRLIDLSEKQQAFIARLEKALLDLVYLEPGGIHSIISRAEAEQPEPAGLAAPKSPC